MLFNRPLVFERLERLFMGGTCPFYTVFPCCRRAISLIELREEPNQRILRRRLQFRIQRYTENLTAAAPDNLCSSDDLLHEIVAGSHRKITAALQGLFG